MSFEGRIGKADVTARQARQGDGGRAARRPVGEWRLAAALSSISTARAHGGDLILTLGPGESRQSGDLLFRNFVVRDEPALRRVVGEQSASALSGDRAGTRRPSAHRRQRGRLHQAQGRVHPLGQPARRLRHGDLGPAGRLHPAGQCRLRPRPRRYRRHLRAGLRLQQRLRAGAGRRRAARRRQPVWRAVRREFPHLGLGERADHDDQPALGDRARHPAPLRRSARRRAGRTASAAGPAAG